MFYEKICWEESSHLLAQNYSHHFDKWWSPENINWEEDSYVLAEYCSHHFLKWWDPEKFYRRSKYFLEVYCKDYKEIWEKHIKE